MSISLAADPISGFKDETVSAVSAPVAAETLVSRTKLLFDGSVL